MSPAGGQPRPAASASNRTAAVPLRLLGVFLFGDPVTASAVAGMALIVAAGVTATTLQPLGQAQEPA